MSVKEKKKPSLEERMLSTIVEALLDAKQDLSDKPVHDWSRILMDSCRRRRFGTDQSPFVSSC